MMSQVVKSMIVEILFTRNTISTCLAADGSGAERTPESTDLAWTVDSTSITVTWVDDRF